MLFKLLWGSVQRNFPAFGYHFLSGAVYSPQFVNVEGGNRPREFCQIRCYSVLKPKMNVYQRIKKKLRLESDKPENDADSKHQSVEDKEGSTSGKMATSESSENPQGQSDSEEPQPGPSKPCVRDNAAIRTKLIWNELPELQALLPSTCKIIFDDPDKIHDFQLIVKPDEGHWKDGEFNFHVFVTEDYNFAPPKVKCRTKIWHPNINEDGAVCLSILRAMSIDETGWNPTRRLKDIVWGLNSLFTDLLNFHDPLNAQASEMYSQNRQEFQRTVDEYIRKYCTPC